MTTWREVTLAEVCERITVGHVGKMSDEYVSEGVPFFRSQNVKPFKLASDGLLFISETFHRRLAKSELHEDDVVVVRTGYPGTAAVVPATFDGANCADLVVITPSLELNPHMLTAIFNSAWGRSSVSGQLVGSAQQHFNVGSAKRMRVRLPDRRSQDAIAEVLCALSETIENNERRAAILKEMARAIYREWFIHHRYPGHERDTIVNSPIGSMPEGWRVSTVGDELATLGGGTPSKAVEAYWDRGTVPWFTPSDLTKSRTRYTEAPALRITSDGVSQSSARRFPAGSVLMTSRATLGVLSIATVDATTNQGFIVIPPDRRWSSGFIYEWLDSVSESLAAVATGATFKEITKGAFKREPFVVPAQEVLDTHTRVLCPVEAQIRTLEEQGRDLKTLRDLLLPKLVNGQIDVSSLDLSAPVESTAA